MDFANELRRCVREMNRDLGTVLRADAEQGMALFGLGDWFLAWKDFQELAAEAGVVVDAYDGADGMLRRILEGMNARANRDPVVGMGEALAPKP